MSQFKSPKIKTDPLLGTKEKKALGLFTESCESNGEPTWEPTLQTTLTEVVLHKGPRQSTCAHVGLLSAHCSLLSAVYCNSSTAVLGPVVGAHQMLVPTKNSVVHSTPELTHRPCLSSVCAPS